MISRLPRPLIYALVAVLCTAGLAAVHGTRIVDNWHTPQWEDAAFFQHNATQIHSLWDCFAKTGVWPGRYLPLTTNLYYYVGAQAWSNRVEVYHFVNLLFLILNAMLLYRLAENLVGVVVGNDPRGAVRVAPGDGRSGTAHLRVSGPLRSVLHDPLSRFVIPLAQELQHSPVGAICRDLRSGSADKEAAAVLPAILIVYGWLLTTSCTAAPTRCIP